MTKDIIICIGIGAVLLAGLYGMHLRYPPKPEVKPPVMAVQPAESPQEFQARRDSALAAAKKFSDAAATKPFSSDDDYRAVVSSLEPFLTDKDQEVIAAHKRAKIQMYEWFVSQVAPGDAREFASIYTTLTQLDPSNEKYKALRAQYVGKYTSLEKLNSLDLCKRFRRQPNDDYLLKELERRGLTDQNLSYIKQHKITMGMPELGLFCAWGAPTDVNRTVMPGHVSTQYVYHDGSQLVYVEDGVITALQD